MNSSQSPVQVRGTSHQSVLLPGGKRDRSPCGGNGDSEHTHNTSTSILGPFPSKDSIRIAFRELTSMEALRAAVEELRAMPVREGEERSRNVQFKFIDNFMSCGIPFEAINESISDAAFDLCRYHLNVSRGETIATYFASRFRSCNGRWYSALFGETWQTTAPWSAKLLANGSGEIRRAVKVTLGVVTGTVRSIADADDNRPLVVTGESGSGKTIGAMMGATLKEHHYGLYIASAGGGLCSPDAGLDDDAKRSLDTKLSEYLVGAIEDITGVKLVDHHVCGESQKLCTSCAGKCLASLEGSVLSVIVDEMGSNRNVLRAFLRFVDFHSLTQRIKLSFGVGAVRFVAVGTGCDDVIYPAGSRPETYSTVFTRAEDGRDIWAGLMGSLRRTSLLSRCVCVMAAGVGSGDVPEGDKDIFSSVEAHPEGFLLVESGRALVSNARMAALIGEAVLPIVGLNEGTLAARDADKDVAIAKHECDDDNTTAVASTAIADAIAKSINTKPKRGIKAVVDWASSLVFGIHCLAIFRFVSMNGLSKYTAAGRLHAVAKALALAMNCSDASLPHDMFETLCTTAGVLTSHAVYCGEDKQKHGRGIDCDPTVVVKDLGRRYRVTQAVMSLYLSNFGATPKPALTFAGFERLLLNYVGVAVVPASIIHHWSLEKVGSSLEQLANRRAPESPHSPRSALFQLLVDTMKATAATAVRSFCMCRLPTYFEPRGARGYADVDAVWREITQREDKDEAGIGGDNSTDVAAVVLNADKASGADLMLLCPKGFAMHIQAKTHQATRASVRSMLQEFVKMGAPLFAAEMPAADRLIGMELSERVATVRAIGEATLASAEFSSLTEINTASEALGSLVNLAKNVESKERRAELTAALDCWNSSAKAFLCPDDKAGVSLKLKSATFPNHSFVLVRCVSAAGVEDVCARVMRALLVNSATHGNCHYIEVSPGDGTLFPFSVQKLPNSKTFAFADTIDWLTTEAD